MPFYLILLAVKLAIACKFSISHCSKNQINFVPSVDCPGSGTFRDPADCACYWTCWPGDSSHDCCSDGLVYNTAGFCDWPDNVDCDDDSTPTPAPGPSPTPTLSGVPSLEEAEAVEEELTSSPMFEAVKYSISTLDSDSVDNISPGKPDNPANVRRVEQLLAESDWNYLFPRRNPEYTYKKFLQAVGKFPAICGDYADRDADQLCKKTLTTMFAHFTQETGGHNPNDAVAEWRQGLVHLTEMGCNQTAPGCG